MRICLCLREARTSETGFPPPPRAGGARAASGLCALPREPSVGRSGWVAQRRPGRAEAQARAGERATRPGETASTTGPRSSTQSPTTRRPDRTDDRACTDARPRLQPPVPTPDSSPALSPSPSASHRWSTHPSQIRHQPTHHARPARCRRPAPGPPAPAWANPHHIYLARRGRGVRREAPDPPSSKAQAGHQRNTRRRGGGLVRSGEKHMERNRWRETQGAKHPPTVRLNLIRLRRLVSHGPTVAPGSAA